MPLSMKIAFFVLALSGVTALSAVAAPSVPTGCDPSVMSEAYWKVWNDAEHPKTFEVRLRAGENRVVLKTRAGSSRQWFAGLFLPGGSELGVK